MGRLSKENLIKAGVILASTVGLASAKEATAAQEPMIDSDFPSRAPAASEVFSSDLQDTLADIRGNGFSVKQESESVSAYEEMADRFSSDEYASEIARKFGTLNANETPDTPPMSPEQQQEESLHFTLAKDVALYSSVNGRADAGYVLKDQIIEVKETGEAGWYELMNVRLPGSDDEYPRTGFIYIVTEGAQQNATPIAPTGTSTEGAPVETGVAPTGTGEAPTATGTPGTGNETPGPVAEAAPEPGDEGTPAPSVTETGTPATEVASAEGGGEFAYPTPEIAEKLASYEVIYETTVTLPNGQESHWRFVADAEKYQEMGRFLYSFGPESQAVFQQIVNEYLEGLKNVEGELALVSMSGKDFQENPSLQSTKIIKSNFNKITFVLEPEPTEEMIAYTLDPNGRPVRSYYIDQQSTPDNTVLYIAGDTWDQMSPEEFEDSDLYFAHSAGYTGIAVIKQAIELNEKHSEEIVMRQAFLDYFQLASPGPWEGLNDFNAELASTVVPYTQDQ